jgi:hypothetical protein
MPNETKHTLGPWNLRQFFEHGEFMGYTVYSAPFDGIADIPDASDTGEANAHLIAAAPDLLEALRALQQEVKSAVKFDVKKHYSLMVADVAASKAIEKAEGR